MTTSKFTNIGEIQPDVLYTLSRAQELMGVKRAGFATMRKNGLNVRYCGVRGFVYGKDLIEYVTQKGRRENSERLATA